MNITNLQVLELRQALMSLDAFKFSAATTLTLAKNLYRVEGMRIPLEETRKKLFIAAGTPQQGTPAFQKFADDYDTLLATPTEANFLTISYDDLRVGFEADKNPIPTRVLSILLPLITGGPEE